MSAKKDHLLFVSFFSNSVFKIETLCCPDLTYALQSESTLYSVLNVKEGYIPDECEFWYFNDCNWTQIHNHLVSKQKINHLLKFTKWLTQNVSTYLYGAFDCMFCHVRYVFQSEFTVYSCLNITEIFAWNRCHIWGLSVCNGTRDYLHLVCKKHSTICRDR